MVKIASILRVEQRKASGTANGEMRVDLAMCTLQMDDITSTSTTTMNKKVVFEIVGGEAPEDREWGMAAMRRMGKTLGKRRAGNWDATKPQEGRIG